MSELQQVLPTSVGDSGTGNGEGTELQVGDKTIKAGRIYHIGFFGAGK